MKIDECNNIHLDSGRTLEDLNTGHSGLSINSYGDLATGYDDVCWCTSKLTLEERREIAAFMVAEWMTWANEGT